jgi:hypothetical protein
MFFIVFSPSTSLFSNLPGHGIANHLGERRSARYDLFDRRSHFESSRVHENEADYIGYGAFLFILSENNSTLSPVYFPGLC